MKIPSYWQSDNCTYYWAVIPKEEIDKIDFALCKGSDTGTNGGRQNLKEYYDSCARKPDLIINGGLFNMANGETIFVYKDNGKDIMTYTNNEDYFYGIGTLKENNRELVYGKMNNNFLDFVTAYPMLLINGQVTPQTSTGWKDGALANKHLRTGIGWNDKNIYFIVLTGENKTGKGATLLEFANFAKNTIGCKYLANLDGGGSVAMLKDGEYIFNQGRKVDNVVALYLKKENTPVTPDEPQQAPTQALYRVQVGAYLKESNAKVMLDRIKNNTSYSTAYIRKVNEYYKVQIGAFSKLENAKQVVNKLKAQGFPAFIAQ